MSDWEIKHLHYQIERLENKVNETAINAHKESTARFCWLIILSNILFWFCIAHINLRHDFDKQSRDPAAHIVTKQASQKNKS